MQPSLRQIQDWNVHNDLLSRQREIEVLMLQSTVKKVDKLALNLAFKTLVMRHDILRSYFFEKSDSLVWETAPYIPDLFKIECFDLTLETFKRPAEDKILARTKCKMHDLAKPPLIILCLFKIDDLTYNLTVMIHHIISDTSSLNIIKDEINYYYKIAKKLGNIKEIELPIQFCEYVLKQQKLNSYNINKQIKFWTSRFENLDYMTFKQRGLQKKRSNEENLSLRSYLDQLENVKGASYTSILEAETLSCIKDLSKNICVGISAIFYASFFITILKKKQTGTILISSPISGRDTQQTSNVIGNFMAGVYLSFSINDNTSIQNFIYSIYSDYILACRNKIFNHNQVGLDSDRLRAICDLFFNYESSPIQLNINDNLHIGHQKIEEQYYPFSCYMSQYNDKALLRWRYSFMEHTQDSIEDFAIAHKEILAKICQNPLASILTILN